MLCTLHSSLYRSATSSPLQGRVAFGKHLGTSTIAMVFYKTQPINVIAGAHSGKHGTFLKYNGGRTGNACVCLLFENGNIIKRYINDAGVLQAVAAAPALAPAPAAAAPALAPAAAVPPAPLLPTVGPAPAQVIALPAVGSVLPAAVLLPAVAVAHGNAAEQGNLPTASSIYDGTHDPPIGLARAITDDPGFIYVFEDVAQGRVKVGRARDVIKRLQAGQTWIPRLRIRSMHYCRDYIRGEQIVHHILAPARFQNFGPGNEWFICPVALASVACARASGLSV